MYWVLLEERSSCMSLKSALAEKEEAKISPLPLTWVARLSWYYFIVVISLEAKDIKQLFSVVKRTPSGMK